MGGGDLLHTAQKSLVGLLLLACNRHALLSLLRARIVLCVLASARQAVVVPLATVAVDLCQPAHSTQRQGQTETFSD